MTEERSQADTDGVTDTLVSRTYRESASERVPEALDRAVLRQARHNSSQRYSRSVIWLRPMAWAATIGLSLAIVLEFSDLPRPESVEIEAPALSEDEHVIEEIVTSGPEKTNVIEHDKEERLEQRARKTVDEAGRVNLGNVPQLSKTRTPEQAPIPANTIGLVEPRPADDAPARSLADKKIVRVQEAPILEEAEALARQQAEYSKEAVVSSFAYSTSPAAAIPMPCEAVDRETPESWLECIEELDEAGLDDIAGLQREQLQLAFPDFEMR
jgi:hypothetical protein